MNNNRNNNNNNNNRRRGRGNRQQQGGGNQNRIDSRARGNAPQMLEKYKKLAQDAQHNGDRVQAEYYLQFADHYFRVIADNRTRQEEPRSGAPRREQGDFQSDDEGGEDYDFGAMRDERPVRDDRPRAERPRDDRPRDDRPRDDRPREDRGPRDDRPRDDRPRDDRGPRNSDRPGARPRNDDREDGERTRSEPASEFEPAENPFIRGDRNRDGNRDGARRGRGRRDNAPGASETDAMVSDGGEIDAAALPPSFSAAVEEEAAPKRKLPPRRSRKPAADDSDGEGEGLTAVG